MCRRFSTVKSILSSCRCAMTGSPMLSANFSRKAVVTADLSPMSSSTKYRSVFTLLGTTWSHINLTTISGIRSVTFSTSIMGSKNL